MKKVEIEGKLFNVCTMDEYTEHPELYAPKFTAIQLNNMVLPIRNNTMDTEPGVYYQPGAMVSNIKYPDNKDDYSSNNIIDFSNAESIAEIFDKQQAIRDIQNDIMTNSDNTLHLNIGPDDTPEMKALKSSINAKRIDPKQYEDRFEQYQNDMRLLKGKSITLGKLISISNAFDISVDLTLRDKDADSPNPMNQTITIDLTDGR